MANALSAEKAALKGEIFAVKTMIQNALKELGVPGPGYSAPVANAVEILRAAL